MVGLGPYGRGFQLSNPSVSGMDAPASGASVAGAYTREAGYLAYYEVRACNDVSWTIALLFYFTILLNRFD